jgi:Prokaryotic N-terminal methylation motif
MRFASTGIRAALRLLRKRGRARAGFTLLEALVALALLVAFAATLGPYLFHARRIMAGVDDRIAAQVLLRSLLDAPFDRETPVRASRAGEAGGMRWRILAEPIAIYPKPAARRRQISPEQRQGEQQQSGQQQSGQQQSGQQQSGQQQKEPAAPPVNWTTFRVIASVSWAPGRFVSAETVRLGKSD